jgi:uncharacterized repeat protein (TIGR01451 family)
VERVNPLLLSIILGIFMALAFLPIRSEAFAVSGTGVGIRLDGASSTWIGGMIDYTISVDNLGDYWVRNTTVTDTFPNGTRSSWSIHDLAPLGQPGDHFNISGIAYTVRAGDVIFGQSPYVGNHAEVTGYADVQGLGMLVHAVTNYPTIILGIPVGGYAVNIKNTDLSASTNALILLLFIMTVGFVAFRRGKARA